MTAKDRKVFFLYTLTIVILVSLGFSLLYIFDSKESYYIVVRFYNVIEYTILAYFFSLHLKNKVVKKVLLFSPILFAAFCILNFLKATTPELPFVPLVVEYVTLLIFIVYFFFEVMQDITTEPVYQKPVFWISAAFILNFSGNFFLFLYSKNSYNDEAFNRQYLIIYGTVTIAKNILLSISAIIKENQSIENGAHPFDSKLDMFHPF
jgi:hypothetical protein